MDSARLKQRGNDFIKAGRLEDALKCYSDALELTSTDHLLLSNRSLVLCKLGRYAEALSDAEKCIQVSPQWAKGYLRKAVALIHIGKCEDAEKSCECGYRLQHDKRLSQDLVSQWLIARKQQMQPLVSNCFFELPTGTQILSEKYYVVLLKVIQARLSAAGGMSNIDMGHCLLAGFEELRDTLSNFGVKDASPMDNWINALCTELDPQSTTVSAEHHSFVMKKTHEFIQWLNLLDTVLHCIIRPLVALAFLVISTRCWVLQCADAGAHYVALLTEACFPLFEDSLLNTTEYIGYHVGTLSGYLGSFIGRSPSFTEAEAPILKGYCEKLKVLLTKYPPTQMEYKDVKSIALHNLSILESMLKAHDSPDGPSSDVLAEEGVISGETARRLARQRPKEVSAYIQKLIQEYESKATQSTTADDAKNLIASAAACIELRDLDCAHKLLQYGEQAYFRCLMYLLWNETLTLDDAVNIITVARQDITLVALLLQEASTESFTKQLVDIVIRWKGLYSELRSCLTQLGLGENYRQTFLEINDLASTGDPNGKFFDVVQHHKHRERQFLRNYLIPTLNALFLHTVATVQSHMKSSQVVLDYVVLPDHFQDSTEKFRGFVMYIPSNSPPTVAHLNCSLLLDAVLKWRKCLIVNNLEALSQQDHPELPGKNEAAELSRILFPPEIISAILGSRVQHLVICPDASMGSLPLDLLPLKGDKSLFETHALTILTSPREIARKVTIQYITRNIAGTNGARDIQGLLATDVEKLQISKSQSTSSLPFLPSTQYSTQNYSQVTFINPDEITIENIASANSSETETTQCNNCCLLADPNYDLQNPDANPPGCFLALKQLGELFLENPKRKNVVRLPLSAEEVQRIEHILRVQSHDAHLNVFPPVLGDKATLTFVLNLQSPHLLHLSTHGVCDDQEWYAYHGNFWSLNKTALMLAGVNTYLAGEPRKLHKDAGVGMLTGLALSGMNLRETNLVFLSSCVSGTGSTPIQESVVSLASCARAAGSSTVIGTLWPILDTTAVKFSSLFYSKLCSAPGICPSDAIAAVKQTMKQDGDHWYNWAAYVCFGCDKPFLNTAPML